MGRPKGRNFKVLLSIKIPAKLDGELAKEAKRIGMGSKAGWARFILMNRKDDTTKKMLRRLEEQK
ncbi:hypothetical protein LCGC14_0398830 [marine sediment metagenome]|uniref:Uncharacterized protein n=1 Tax=marine sediment metagenome TaxID=412755 RepID=A0A0F9TFF3_9ZZZZ|nr:hypothetical protein [Candidatus Aminicenantes bacterium]